MVKLYTTLKSFTSSFQCTLTRPLKIQGFWEWKPQSSAHATLVLFYVPGNKINGELQKWSCNISLKSAPEALSNALLHQSHRFTCCSLIHSKASPLDKIEHTRCSTKCLNEFIVFEIQFHAYSLTVITQLWYNSTQHNLTNNIEPLLHRNNNMH